MLVDFCGLAADDLFEATAGADPLLLAQRWLQDALDANVSQPYAMTLATVDQHGRPSARVLLLKQIDNRGFVFFTSYASRKGQELAANPCAAMVFYWHGIERQVRVEGTVERLAKADSDAYFNTRPRGSRLAVWAAEQSQPLASRAALEQRVCDLDAAYGDGPIPRPASWGGYRLVPHAIEFWQARASRLHDRLCYTRSHASWRAERLAP